MREEINPETGGPRFYAGCRLLAACILYLRHAVYEHAGYSVPRNQRMALAAYTACVHDNAGIRIGFYSLYHSFLNKTAL